MRILWSSAAWADLDRLHAFLAEHDLDAPDSLIDRLVDAPAKLIDFPRSGSRLSEFEPREVREYRVAAYLMRYEIASTDIFVLRFFHARKDRF